MKSVFLFVAVTLLLLPLAFSFDCSSVENSGYCEEIQDSDLSINEKELIFATLLYQETNYPNHEFINTYNNEIDFISKPFGNIYKNSQYIKAAWFSFSAISPSVYVNDVLLVPDIVEPLSHYDYAVNIPSNHYSWFYSRRNRNIDCRTIYNLVNNDASIGYYVNGIYQTQGEGVVLNINSDSTIEAQLNIHTVIQIDHFRWVKRCRRCIPRCRYSHTSFDIDNVQFVESKEVELYNVEPTVNISVINNYRNTVQSKINASEYSYFRINFTNSYLSKTQYSYSVVFDEYPHYIAVLEAYETPLVSHENLFVEDTIFYVNNLNTCLITAYNHFFEIEEDCGNDDVEVDVVIEVSESDVKFAVFLYIGLFLILAYILFKIGKSQFGKIILPLLLIPLISMPSVLADTGTECGITNIASCLPEVIYDFILNLINLPLSPLLSFTQTLLTAPVATELFFSLWSIVRYMTSIFYVFFFIYSGFILTVSGADPLKRAHAKEMLKDTLLMIVLVQGSYYIYQLFVSLSSTMGNSLMNLVDPTFFMLTANNLTNIGLEFMFIFLYVIVLLFAVLLLIIRYVVVSLGVAFFPIGIFCFFIPPLKKYGQFILTMLGLMIFVTCFDILVVLGCSMLIDITLFASMEILVMITCFQFIILSLWMVLKFALKGMAFGTLKDDVSSAVKYIALLL